jgi:hypothetical protein
VRRDEVMALSAQFANNELWAERYALLTSEGRAQVPFDTYVSKLAKPRTAITEYATVSMEINGDDASVTRVFGLESEDNYVDRRDTSPLVIEDGHWRIVLDEEDLQFYLG